ncbi:MAG: recombination protein RecR [bacterium]|nr:MAG: recombination protein RecR [bacterium]
MAASAGPEIERLISLLAKLPGLGPRSARRAALALLKKREQLLVPLAASLAETAAKVTSCSVCGAPDTRDPCSICSNGARDNTLICVVEEAGALWAMERSGAFRGKYHVLGGLLSALDGVGPDALRVAELVGRVRGGEAKEVVLALPATVDGQTTAHYIAERLAGTGVEITSLARGVPREGRRETCDQNRRTGRLACPHAAVGRSGKRVAKCALNLHSGRSHRPALRAFAGNCALCALEIFAAFAAMAAPADSR